RFGPIAQLVIGTGGQNPSQVVQRLGKIRIELDSLAIVLDGFIQMSLGGKGDAQTVQGPEAGWTADLDCLEVVLDGFTLLPVGGQSETQIILRFKVGRIDLNGFAVKVYRFVNFPVNLERAAEVVAGQESIRIPGDGGPPE